AMLETLLDYLREPLVVLSGTQISALTLLTAILIIVVAKIASVVIGRSIERVLEVRDVDKGVRFAAGRIARYVVIVIGMFVAIGTLGIDTSAMMGAAAVLLVGIGFGLQKLAENFISGLLVLIERPVRKGDFIDAGGVLGVVDDIGLRATRVTSRDGVQVIVPNSHLMTNIVVNYSQPSHERRFQVDIGVAYGTDLELASKVILDVAKAEPKVLGTPAPEVRHMGFGDSSIHLILLIWIQEAKEDLIVGSRLRFALDKAFREHSIKIPFPQRDVHMTTRVA
ncbi:MAG TPA: mechanosensitive ion channel domain-containing protein, partial [Kofleriaceae bacterium]|nr:mechanosensitive ion channel domain-containing protein [Kofleriaceae bacterium]